MLTHVLDTSAWIAHIRGETDGAAVTALFEDDETEIGISTLSIVELHGILKAVGKEAEFEEVVEDYRSLFAQIIPVDETIAFRAVTLRQNSSSRLPGIDAIIAASAAQNDAILVHRDSHYLAISNETLKQTMLGKT